MLRNSQQSTTSRVHVIIVMVLLHSFFYNNTICLLLVCLFDTYLFFSVVNKCAYSSFQIQIAFNPPTLQA